MKIKLKDRKIEELIGAEYNPRVISEEELSILQNSIQRFGIVEPILVNINSQRKDIIISGHQRLKACISLGMKNVPTIELDLTLEKEKELNVRMNKSGGQFDKDLLQEHFNYDDLLEYGFQSYEVSEDDDVNLEEFFEENTEEIEEENNTIVLEYTDEEYKKVIDKLAELDGTKEQIIYKLLQL
tara:strand:+ start:1874 stop:2425 length:552 start_codon:yes stop_codon:yes gene_type:complete